MYLSGFPGAGDPFSPEFYTVNQGADPDACRANGGTPSFTDSYRTNPTASELIPYAQRQQKVRTWICSMPAPVAQSASNPINVNSSVQSNVSPQVSPVFVQQDQPTNSPVNAGTSQASPSPQSTGTSQSGSGVQRDTSFDDYLQAQRERDAQAEKRWNDFINAASAPLAPVSPVPQFYSGGAAVDSGMLPPAPVTAGPDNSLRNGLLIAAAGVLLSALVSRRKTSKAKR